MGLNSDKLSFIHTGTSLKKSPEWVTNRHHSMEACFMSPPRWHLQAPFEKLREEYLSGINSSPNQTHLNHRQLWSTIFPHGCLTDSYHYSGIYPLQFSHVSSPQLARHPHHLLWKSAARKHPTLFLCCPSLAAQVTTPQISLTSYTQGFLLTAP